MLKSDYSRWVAANALGFCVAFLSFIPGSSLTAVFIPEEVNDPAMMLDPLLDPEIYAAAYRGVVIGHGLMLALFGAILASAQYWALRDRLPSAAPWILAGAGGFVSILVLELVERHIVVGPYPGPVEPVVIALGGGIAAGFLQWLVLRGAGFRAGSGKWLALWVAGLVVGIAALFPIVSVVEIVITPVVVGVLGPETAETFGWGVELALIGIVVGAAAGAVSGRAMVAALAPAPAEEG
jgi:hypothetical protein